MRGAFFYRTLKGVAIRLWCGNLRFIKTGFRLKMGIPGNLSLLKRNGNLRGKKLIATPFKA
jgi:hypothetical protein